MHSSSLNHTYRLVWSACSNTYVAVAETTRGRGKKSRSGKALNALVSVAAGALLACSGAGLGAQTIDNGNGGTGRFVESGTLSLSNTTITNYSTIGGTGSGGGAGLGGAIFINLGASVTLNNVNFVGNTVIGGAAISGTNVGGSLNNYANSSVQTPAKDGYTPDGIVAIDVNGTGGTKGNVGNIAPGLAGGTGGFGGAGGKGGDRNDFLITGVALGVADVALSAASIVTAGVATGMAFIELATASSSIEYAALVVAIGNLAVGIADTGLAIAGTVTSGLGLAAASTELALWDKALSNGQIGLGGAGGQGGTGGVGDFGKGGGIGGKGGNGGVGGSNWSGSAFNGGAQGGDAGSGGNGGMGGFGAGGGNGGEGGKGGAGAGASFKAGTAEVPAETQIVKEYTTSYDEIYTDPSDASKTIVVIAGLKDPKPQYTLNVSKYGYQVDAATGNFVLDGAGKKIPLANEFVVDATTGDYVLDADGKRTTLYQVDPVTGEFVLDAGGKKILAAGATAGTVKLVDVTVKNKLNSTVIDKIVETKPKVAATGDSNFEGKPYGLDGSGGAGGAGGFGAGAGANGKGYGALAGGGSGGSGFGGAIFVRSGGNLTIKGTAKFEQNSALGGDGQDQTVTEMAGAPGSAAGTDLFMMKGSNVMLAPGGNNIITFNGSIADDSGIAGVADGNGASLTVQDGLVIFNGANTYSGQTKIAAKGVLQAMDGTGIATSSNINFIGGTIDGVTTGGVLQTNGLFNRFVGTASTRIQWTGDGGFAAQGGALEVSLSNNQTLTWGANSFVPNGNKLLFGSATATDAVTFDNAINLNGATRTILVTANDATLSGVAANTDTATLKGVLSNGGLVVGDATHNGILIIDNTNTYTGGTTVNGGTLRESATGFLADTGFLTVDGSTAVFDLGANHNDMVGIVTLNNGGTLAGSGTSAIKSDTSFEMKDGTVNIFLDGTGVLNKTTTGTVTLNKQNTYTGLTTVSAGTLAYGTDNALATGDVIVTGATAVLDLKTYNDTVGTVTLDGAGTINATGSNTTNGTLTSTGSFEIKSGTVNAKLGGEGIALNKTTDATVNLNNQNSYTGLTTVSAGKLNYGVDNAIATGQVTVNGATAILELNTFNDSVGTVTLDGAGTINATGSITTNGTLTSTGSFEVKSGTVNAKLGGTGIVLNKTSDGSPTGGTVTLNNQNTYTGLTTVSAGKLNYGVNDAIASGAVTVNGSTAELALNSFTDTVGTVTLDNAGLISGSGTLTSTGSFELKDGTVNAILGGTGIVLNKTTGGATPDGTVTLNNQNTYTGLTTVSAGKLAYGTNNAIATGAVTITGIGSELALGAFNDSVGTVTLASAGLISGSGTLTSTGSFEMKDGTVNAMLGGTDIVLNKTTAGIVTLNNQNSYTGLTTVSAGKLVYGTDNAIATGAITITGIGSELALGAFNDSVGTVTLASAGLISGTGTLTSTGTFEMKDGTVNAKLGGVGIVLNKTTAGTVTLNNQNSYTGLTTVSAGKLAYGTNNAIATGAVTITGTGSELALGAFNDSVGTVTLASAGLISGTGTLTSTGSFEMKDGTVNAILAGVGIALNKTTAGTVTLNNQNTYTGNTTVSAGSLVLASTTAPNLAPTTAVTVASGASLVVNGNNTVASLTSNGAISGNMTLTAPTYNLNDGTQVTAKLGNVTTGSTLNSNGAVTLSNSVAATTINVQTGKLTVAGLNLLSIAAAVDIATVAELSLTGGDQTIKTLNGSGTLTLNGYNLNVIQGGSFTGSTTTSGALTKSGTGQLDLSGTNTFTQGTTVDAGTVANTGTINTSNTVVNNGGTLNNTGTINNSNVTVDTIVNTGGKLLNNGTITNNVLVNVGGTFGGNGTITGKFTGNGTTSPGNSPGIMTVTGNYVENGQLDIEVWGKSGAGHATAGHDQVLVGGTTTLNPASSILNLMQTSTFEPAKGDKFTFIQGAPGSISGSFKTFQSNFANDMIVNLSTGELIGTGLLTATTGSNLLNAMPGASANLQAMVNNLKVANHQYAGGDLISLLLAPGVTASDISLISNRASPEAYAGFSEYAGRATSNYTESAVNMRPMTQTDKYAIFAGYTNFDTGSSSSLNQADYSLKSKGAITGMRFTVSPQFTAGVFVGIDSGSLDTTYTKGSTTGNVYGLFGEFSAGADKSLTVTGSLSLANYTSEGTRATAGTSAALAGLSRFKGVGSNASSASVALKYRAIQSPTMLIQPEFSVGYLNSSVNSFDESNTNKLQALHVAAMNTNSMVTEAAVNGKFLVNPQFTLNGRLGVSHQSAGAERDVTAHVVGETTSFTVRSPGIGATAVNLGMGASLSVTDKFTLSAAYRKAMISGAQSSNSFNINAALSF